MKKILYICDFKFWNRSQGCHTRMNILIEKLNMFDAFFLYTGRLSRKDKIKIQGYGFEKKHFLNIYPFKRKIFGLLRRMLRLLRLPVPNSFLHPIKQSNFTKRKLSKFCKKNGIDIIWVNYVWNYDYVSRVSNNVLKIIDTHDVQSEIVSNKKNLKQYFPSNLNFEEECNILKRFDLIIAISKRDYNIFKRQLDNIVYLPFYFKTNDFKLSQKQDETKEIKIGFLGGEADFNVVAVNRLVEQVLPLCTSNFKLLIFGTVCEKVANLHDNNVELKGFVENVLNAYEQVDIMINPASFGSGLKTKCIEAMAYGVPLITTSIGAQGIEEAKGECYLMGNTDRELAQCIDELVTNSSERADMAKKQIKYIDDNFGDKLYFELSDKINEIVEG